MEPHLEHFAHVEDVVNFVKAHLPPNADATAWKNVCEDVLHCELTKVEPLLTEQLAQQDAHHHREEDIRALLRAASWYTHPQLSTEALLTQADQLQRLFSGDAVAPKLDQVRAAIRDQYAGHEARLAAQILEELLERIRQNPSLEAGLLPARELRDQIYYQLLYPHWFETVKQWKEKQRHK